MQGDFISVLMSKLGPELDKPASKQLSHTLVAELEAAIRASNAQYENKDIRERLGIKVTSNEHTRGPRAIVLTSLRPAAACAAAPRHAP